MQVVAAVMLGDDVTLARDTTFRVQLGGSPVARVAETVRIDGSVDILGGTVEVQSKRFVVDRGTVSFTGRPVDDPLVAAEAHWDAPDGTRVFARVSGSVKRSELTLRSEPPHSRDDIVALVLFGTVGGSFGASPPVGREATGAAQAAGSLAAAAVVQAINRSISGLTRVNVVTRIDTSQAGNPRPELDIQLSKRLSARLSYSLGVPPPGDNPDRTQLTLDLKIAHEWAIDTMFGDRGSTSFDVVWRIRY
jgi:translocation and assembly module TamB